MSSIPRRHQLRRLPNELLSELVDWLPMASFVGDKAMFGEPKTSLTLRNIALGVYLNKNRIKFEKAAKIVELKKMSDLNGQLEAVRRQHQEQLEAERRQHQEQLEEERRQHQEQLEEERRWRRQHQEQLEEERRCRRQLQEQLEAERRRRGQQLATQQRQMMGQLETGRQHLSGEHRQAAGSQLDDQRRVDARGTRQAVPQQNPDPDIGGPQQEFDPDDIVPACAIV